ncbi:vascular endothelial growth factor receptor 2-like [Paramuricea clavata]|uniref:Vascular endothelial growth factor receptor 2-like n=1 Tax=Paramuricea clavata TaxID=317549 RepID=A0A6S7HGG4_PARCT|nr:vascular endothelial growth factor receptor 2-like [Paramuricea clavata]
MSMLAVVVACFVLYRRKKIYGGFYLFSYPPLLDYMETIDRNGNIQEQLRRLPFIPEWEFPRERISFASKLSSGQFGIVWLAEAIGISAFHPRDMLREREGGRRFSFFNRTTKRNSYVFCKEVTQVAVKVIKENFDRNDQADLKTELKILTHVGENENIVNILGACTKGNSSNIWIIIEYCPHGNLREFLRNNRSRYNAEKESFNQDLSQVFGPRNLIYFAWQITKGMEFLTSRKIIYRDLAARNILLGRGYVAKISDFGLARDVHKNQQYLRTSTGLVPFMLKWMAVESIRDSLFTEKSDVWSFGVLLWEIFSLGGTPYPGMNVNEVHQYLLQGKRMDPPIHCPQDIDINSNKWFQDADLRLYQLASLAKAGDRDQEDKNNEKSNSFFDLKKGHSNEEVICATFEKQVGRTQDFKFYYGRNSRGITESQDQLIKVIVKYNLTYLLDLYW